MDFASLSFTVETKAGTLKIARDFIPTTIQELDEIEKEELNLIDLKDLDSYLKKSRETMLFFAKEGLDLENFDDVNAIAVAEANVDLNAVVVKDPELQKVLDEFREVFRDELPDRLPPQRPIDHAIDTGNEAPINRSAYALLVAQIKEQTRQVEALLKRGLIRESTSPWGAPVLFVKKL